MKAKGKLNFKKILFVIAITISIYIFLLFFFVLNKGLFRDNTFIRALYILPAFILSPIDENFLDGRIGICAYSAEDEWFDVDGHKMYTFTVPINENGEIVDNNLIKELKNDARKNAAWYAFWHNDKVVLGFPYEGTEPLSEINFGYKRVSPTAWCKISLQANKITESKEFYTHYNLTENR